MSTAWALRVEFVRWRRARAWIPDRSYHRCLRHRIGVPIVRGDEVVTGRVLRCSLMVNNYVVSGLTGARRKEDFRDFLDGGSFIADQIRQSAEVVPAA